MRTGDSHGAETRNRMRWHRGRRGRYEGWFLAFNHPASKRAYWLRYSLWSPTDESQEPHCQLWFMRTDRARTPRNQALRATYPIQLLAAGADPFWLEVGDGRLTLDTASGQIAQMGFEVSWDLHLESLLPGITATPEWGARVATCFMEPHPLLRVTGTVTEEGRTTTIDGWLGEQGHVFGVRHSGRWHWAEAKWLGREGGAFSGISAWPAIPGGERSLTSLYLNLGDGARLLRNSTLDMMKPVTAHSPEGWRFEAEYTRDRIAAEITPQRDDLIGVTYHDPGGGLVYCYHSELADLALRYYRRARRGSVWRLVDEITAPSAAAFEYGTTTPLPGVPLLLD